MVTNTREKVLEAKYFLEVMKKNLIDRDAFKYNLSAFLSAARSITLIMQKEFDKAPGFEDWYIKKQAEMRGDNVMRLLKDKREMTIHQQPVRPYANFSVSINEQVIITDAISYVHTREDGTIEKSDSEPATPSFRTEDVVATKLLWYFEDLPDKDVISICEEYIIKLETLIEECEIHFSS